MAEDKSKISYQQWAIWLIMGLLALATMGANNVSGRVDRLEGKKLDKEQYYREYDNIGEQLKDVKEMLQKHVEL